MKRPGIYLLILLLAATVNSFYQIAYFLGFKWLGDALATGLTQLFIQAFFFLSISFVVTNIASYYLMRTSERMVIFSELVLRKLVFKRIIGAKIQEIERYTLGDVVTRLNNDTQVLTGYFSDLFGMCIPLLNGSIVLLVALITNWRLTLVVLGIGIIQILIESLVLDKIAHLSRRMQEAIARSAQEVIEIIRGTRSTRLLGISLNATKQFTQTNQDIYANTMRVDSIRNIVQNTKKLNVNLSDILLFFSGGWLLRLGLITLGEFIAIYAVKDLFLAPFLIFGDLILTAQRPVVSRSRLEELVNLQQEPDSPRLSKNNNRIQPSSGRWSIELDNVSFAYKEDTHVLSNFSMKIEHGETVAIIGRSGAGKSTILKLLLKFYAPSGGSVTVLGRPLPDMDHRLLRSSIAYAPQDFFLFDGTILSNIMCSNPQASMKEVDMACQHAGIHDFILSLPDNYNTVLHQGGAALSGGQRQRIALARVFLRRAPIIILDEVSSSLDSITETYIREAISELWHNDTVLIVSHRSAFVKQADRVVNIDGCSRETPSG